MSFTRKRTSVRYFEIITVGRSDFICIEPTYVHESDPFFLKFDMRSPQEVFVPIITTGEVYKKFVFMLENLPQFTDAYNIKYFIALMFTLRNS